MDDHPAEHAEATEMHLRCLNALIEYGTELARMVHERAREELAATPPTESAPDPTVRFERLARTVRRTILLAQHLYNPPKRPPAPDGTPNRTATRARILRRVEDEIQAEQHGEAAAALHRELCERLDSPHFDAELAARPIDELIDDIRADLGLQDPIRCRARKRRTPADIALLHARAAAPPGAAAAGLLLDWLTPRKPAPKGGTELLLAPAGQATRTPGRPPPPD